MIRTSKPPSTFLLIVAERPGMNLWFVCAAILPQIPRYRQISVDLQVLSSIARQAFTGHGAMER